MRSRSRVLRSRRRLKTVKDAVLGFLVLVLLIGVLIGFLIGRAFGRRP